MHLGRILYIFARNGWRAVFAYQNENAYKKTFSHNRFSTVESVSEFLETVLGLSVGHGSRVLRHLGMAPSANSGKTFYMVQCK